MYRCFFLCAAALLSPAASAAPTIEMLTSKGRIVLELDSERAPKTVQNFVQYVRAGFYDATIFHRVIPGFMVQGGGFTAQMEEKGAAHAVANEARNGLKNERGTIAMARTADPHSARSQFFLNQRDNVPLNHPSPDGWGYAVFGRITQGIDVVDAIAAVPTGRRGGHENVPLEPVVIETVRILSPKGKP